MNAIPFMGVFFIGLTKDADALISWGLAITAVNILFDAVGSGLISGHDTLVSQAFGRNDIDSWEIYLNICRYLLILLMVPQGIVIYFSDAILIALGQPVEVSANARYLLFMMFPGLLFMSLYILNRRYFNCVGKTKNILIVSALTLVLHTVLMYLTVIQLNWGLTGIGFSSTISLTLQLTFSEVWASFETVREFKAKWMLPDYKMVSKTATFLSYGVPGLVEWFLVVFPLEVLPIFAGWIGSDEIAANIIMNNVYFLLSVIPFSMSLTAAAFVGNSLGENKPLTAITYIKANIFQTVIAALAVLLAIWVFSYNIVSSYTDSNDVIEIFSRIVPLFLLFNFTEFIYFVTEGILIGVGYQKILVFLIFLWMWVFLIPSVYLGVGNQGLIEIWIIFWIAKACLWVSNFVVIFMTNWDQAALDASNDQAKTE